MRPHRLLHYCPFISGTQSLHGFSLAQRPPPTLHANCCCCCCFSAPHSCPSFFTAVLHHSPAARTTSPLPFAVDYTSRRCCFQCFSVPPLLPQLHCPSRSTAHQASCKKHAVSRQSIKSSKNAGHWSPSVGSGRTSAKKKTARRIRVNSKPATNETVAAFLR